MRRRKIRIQIIRFRLCVAAVALFVCAAAFVCDGCTRSLIRQSAAERARADVNKVINETVAELLDDAEKTRLVDIAYDDNGNAKSAEMNSAEVSKLISKLNSAIAQSVSKLGTQSLKIRLGTFTGNEYLLGRGPNITLKYSIACDVYSSVTDKFEEAGINQTRHSIVLNVKTDIKILIPWYDTSAELTNSIPICETVIVGEVPNTYVSVKK